MKTPISPLALLSSLLLSACGGSAGQNLAEREESSSSPTPNPVASLTPVMTPAPAVTPAPVVTPTPLMTPTSIPSDWERNSFGIQQFFPPADSGVFWESLHWDNGSARALGTWIGDRDAEDPSGWSQKRGSGSPILNITGDGRLEMSGGQPRLYINTYPTGSNDKDAADHLFSNIEFTGYYKRTSDDGEAYGGFVVGMRSGPLGHSTSSDTCEATTYYSRLRHDGLWQFQKELKHPASAVVSTVNIWPDQSSLPLNQWIGMKYALYTEDTGYVRLQAWIDLTEGENGGDWELLGDFTDSGDTWIEQADWGEMDVSGCSYDEKHIIDPGNGVVLIRNTNGSAEYKWITIREINP